jgi:ABC-type sugar transport system ATPase subunit
VRSPVGESPRGVDRVVATEAHGRDVDIGTEVGFLSGGQRQLVAIAGALAFDPEVVIRDEPTSARSVDATRPVVETVERLAEGGVTVVIVPHNIETDPEMADRVGVLYRGSIVDVLRPEEAELEHLNTLMTTGQDAD